MIKFGLLLSAYNLGVRARFHESTATTGSYGFVWLQSLWYYFLGRIFGETSSRRNGVWRRRSARVSAGRKRAIKALLFFSFFWLLGYLAITGIWLFGR